MFTCGASSFSTIDDDKAVVDHPPPKAKSSKKSKNENPYSARGLDKFTMVLAELETKREKIMAKTGTQDVAMIRFMYNNSQDWVPIVIKPKEKDMNLMIQERKVNNDKDESKTTRKEIDLKKKTAKVEKKVNDKNVKWDEWLKWRGSYNWLLVMVLILVCLVMFGRVFAICCVSIWWYAAPTMKERSIKKKEYVRRLSDKRLGSPRTRHGVIPKKG